MPRKPVPAIGELKCDCCSKKFTAVGPHYNRELEAVVCPLCEHTAVRFPLSLSPAQRKNLGLLEEA